MHAGVDGGGEGEVPLTEETFIEAKQMAGLYTNAEEGWVVQEVSDAILQSRGLHEFVPLKPHCTL